MPHVPRSKIFDDIYFSLDNGKEETEYVFLKGNNLPERFSEKACFTICETGFGTGLNFLCAWKAFEAVSNSDQLHFISFEQYPMMKDEMREALSHFFKRGDLDVFLNTYPDVCDGTQSLQITDRIKLTLIFGDMNETISSLDNKIDAWFLDGFSPSKNPEMWTDILFQNMARLSGEGTTFATFTAAGIVRRGLQENGFEVIKAKGFGRKRDMIKGYYHE